MGEYARTPISSRATKGKISSSMSRWRSEYLGWSEQMGAIACARCICATLKFETPMLRTLPAFLSEARVAQPSSISRSGLGQWIWYRSMESTFRRLRLASHSRLIDSALRLRLISRRSFQTMLHFVKT